jgi:hypothetical protein
MPSGHESQSSNNVVTNFSDGAWANYAIESYNAAGVAKGHGILNSTIAPGFYAEKACWVYLENYTFTYNNGTVVHDLVTNYIDKLTYSNQQISQQRFINGELSFNETWGPEAVDFVDDLSLYSNMSVNATGQSVSVPAGTFDTTVRKGQVPDGTLLTIWFNNDVPAWGEVRSQYSNGDHVLCVYLLESYGN